jgi:RES domain-containing protein
VIGMRAYWVIGLRGIRKIAVRGRLQELGTAWARGLSSAVLAVPSVVIPAETNYLLNPLHPAFSQIEIGETQAFFTDLRLFRR